MTEKNNFRIKKRKRRKWMIASLLFFLLMLIGSGYWLYQATEVNTVEIKQDDKSLGIERVQKAEVLPMKNSSIKQKEPKEREDVVHVALFGVDRRSQTETGRSDTIMIATIDYKHNKIKLTSLMRDLYVEVEGRGKTKLNHAYAYGGAELAIKTINQNFGTDIRDYATVDFFALEAIIDAVGGVELDIKEEEVLYVNRHLEETARIQKKKAIHLQDAGKQHLNGLQAVSYARIRYVGDGDFERTQRQRKVLQEMIEEVKDSTKSEMATLAIKVLPHIETSLSRSDVMELVYEYVKQSPYSTEEMRFPLDGTWNGANESGAWVMKTDIPKMKETLTDYLYNDLRPTTLNSSKPQPLPHEKPSSTIPLSKWDTIYKELNIPQINKQEQKEENMHQNKEI